jgi:hypothetical protein
MKEVEVVVAEECFLLISSGFRVQGFELYYESIQNPELKTQNSKPRTQNPELKTQNSKPRTQNPELKTQNSKPRTQNPEPKS